MRKDFTDNNSKEMEVVLKIRVPENFDRDMESRIDEGLANALYDLGCELVDSSPYMDSAELARKREHEQSRYDGLDEWRSMVREELALNGVLARGLSQVEVEEMLAMPDVIDGLAVRMEGCMQRVDGDEYRALEVVFEDYLPVVYDLYREKKNEDLIDSLDLTRDASIDGGTLFINSWYEDDIEIFLGENGSLYCQLPDEDEPRPLKDRIEDIKEGDAFFFGEDGLIRTASDKAHQNFDEPDEPWITYGDDGDCYFEEDIGTALGVKVREVLDKLPAREQEVALEPAEYPLQNYEDAINHLCEVLNERDDEMDLDGVRTPIKFDDFIPIFKSTNYFGVYCYHTDHYYDGVNEYYLVDRNNGEHKMVLGDSFEFVGKNHLDCMKGEKILNVANMEYLQYLVRGSLDNMQGAIPEAEMGGIAVLESAMREEAKKKGHYFMGPSLAERLRDAEKRSDGVVRGSKEQEIEMN